MPGSHTTCKASDCKENYKKKEARAKLHTDGWFLKLLLWVAMNVFPFFLPTSTGPSLYSLSLLDFQWA